MTTECKEYKEYKEYKSIIYSHSNTMRCTIGIEKDDTWTKQKKYDASELFRSAYGLSITEAYTSSYNSINWVTTATTTNSYYRPYQQTADDSIWCQPYDQDWFSTGISPPVLTPSERMRQMIQARMAPVFHRKRKTMSIAMDVREERARQTLRRIIGDQSFRRFMRDGFITVVPKSGLTYRIYPGHDMTDVYDRGVMVDRLCVVLKGDFPPTDSLLMRYLLIMNDEGEFSKFAIKHGVWNKSPTKLIIPSTAAPLTEAWAKLKVA